ncbi:MAG TPA: alpha/beta fold hydrolase [Pyrinomonadaceae bacterium]|jgi:predicted alpha/beta-hydrolase family hydrolase|nr:alpha/beta fold hydrolase [Pyrinomonadaceae bacterium]
MSAEPEQIAVEVGEAGTVTAVIYPAEKRNRLKTTLILGHGAGANQFSNFMRLVSNGLASRGFDVVTFNFLYSERGRGAPDPKPKLELCYESVMAAARRQRKLKDNRMIIGGKSMGGRIASQVAAAGDHKLTGLVFLGYPLHPPGRPEKMRDAHLNDVHAPMLFIQGSKDTFGTPSELKAVIKRLKLTATIFEIETGDHSFKVLKSAGKTQEQVYESIMDEIVTWVTSQK